MKTNLLDLVDSLITSVSLKVLKLRVKHPLFNRLYAKLGFSPSCVTKYGDHIVHYNERGEVDYLNTAPNYPDDFQPANILMSR